MKPESINLYFIPEEYRQQVSDLIQSNNESNWNILYQLMIGFNNNKLSEFAVECYFRCLLNYYLMNYHSWKPNENNTVYHIINTYLFSNKSYKQ